MINAVAVLKPTANVASIAMKVDESRYATAFLLWMTNEVRVERDFISGLYVHDLKRQTVDLWRWYASSMRPDIGIEEQIVLDRVEER